MHRSLFGLITIVALVAACGASDTGYDPDTDQDDPGSWETAADNSNPPPVEHGPQWDADPCAMPYKAPPGYQLIILTDGDDVLDLSNKKGKQMIVGGKGNDTIYAGPGDDIVCAGPGEDTVFGQEGNDYIDGGYGNDTLHGNSGHDVIHGRAGSDYIFGEGGWDKLYGDLLDDKIWGGDGNDLIVGGHGTDFMHGGKGDDWLRGDTNGDQFIGGEGNDVASFATATPPGQAGFGPNPPEGIDLDLALDAGQHCKGRNPQDLNKDIDYPGCAWGDGRDAIMGIETIIGSSFDDRFKGAGGKQVFYGGYGNDRFEELDGTDQAYGGPGSDSCNGAACDAGDDTDPGAALPIVFVNPDPIDLGVVFLGGDENDNVLIERHLRGVRVTETSGQALNTGELCHYANDADHSVVDCDIPNTVHYVLAWGGHGSDTITMGNGFPRDFTSILDGGPCNDILNGGDGQDQMLAGESGNDQLYGNAGDDALISESTDGDLLSAGPGNDQIVTDYPCAGHHYQGGPGQDIAGFARMGTKHRVWAQLGGKATNPSDFHGYALSPGTCGNDKTKWTILDPGLEILEGGSLNDKLFGNDGPNTIWGRDGDDEIRGYGGADVLEGHKGADKLYGGGGQDIIHGGQGYDHIWAKDGTKDHQISCGAGGGKLETSDAFDPNATGCN